MFDKLRRRYLFLSTAILFVIIILVMGLVYFLTSSTIMAQIHFVAGYILENEGSLKTKTREEQDVVERIINPISAEILYETRYFCVWVGEDGTITDANTSFVSSVDENELDDIIAFVSGKHRKSGRYLRNYDTIFYYDSKHLDNGGTLYVFLDCTTRYLTLHQVLFYVGIVWGSVLLFYFVLIRYYSKRIVRPFVENEERQKRFITNASHELKTPLAVISANIEMSEALHGGEDKWTKSTKRQLKRLQSLIEELVVLTRLDEMGDTNLEELDLNNVINEAVEPYRSIAENSGRTLALSLAPGLKAMAEKRGLMEVLNVLLDNASKYCDEGGEIEVSTEKKSLSHIVRIRVSNSYKDGKGQDFERFFERFYRADESHNFQKSGFGIGLSMAKEIVERMRGSIKASYDESRGVIFFDVELYSYLAKKNRVIRIKEE